MEPVANVIADGVGSAWDVARRWQQYRAEVRTNLIRIAAVAAFYLIHLTHHFSAASAPSFWSFLQLGEGDRLAPDLHLAVTLIVFAWTMWAFLILVLLQ